jgi:AcrR family transcriptional regulator
VSRGRKGDRTRESILRLAVDVASVEGLEGLSIGALAGRLKMSKSGLFAHFGSKTELQLAAVEAARAVFVDQAVRPALAAPRGLPRLWALSEAWLSYVERKVFRGGCFFAAASAEFDSRPGPVRDRIAEVMREWRGGLERAVRLAQDEGHLPSRLDADQLAFELIALSLGANWAAQLHRDQAALSRARTAIRERLRSLATRRAPALSSRRYRPPSSRRPLSSGSDRRPGSRVES